MANIETDADGRPVAYDSAGRPLATDAAGRPIAVDTVHGRPVTVDGRAYDDRVAPGGTVVGDRYVGDTVAPRRSSGAGWLIALLIIVALVVAAFAFKLINIDEISGGAAPKVQVTGGALPKFQVDTAKVDVGTKEDTIKTPTVAVGTKDTTVAVPTLHVEKADDANKPQP